MVAFWIFTALVYCIVGIIILQWMNDVILTNGGTEFDMWQAFMITLLWPVTMYGVTFLTICHGIWLLCKKVWRKIKLLFKKDNITDNVDNNDTNSTTDEENESVTENENVQDLSTGITQ